MTTFLSVLNHSSYEALDSFLSSARVESGYVTGRRIFINGYKESVTFTAFAKRSETLYNNALATVHSYVKNNKNVGRGMSFINVDQVMYAIKGHERVMKKLYQLKEQSDNPLEKLAKKQCSGKMTLFWDTLLHVMNGWEDRVDCERDKSILSRMCDVRPE